MTQQNGLLASLLRAARGPVPDGLRGGASGEADPTPRVGANRDHEPVLLKADRTVGACRVALDRLGELVEAIPKLELRADPALLQKLLVLGAKTEVFLSQLDHFVLQVKDGGLQAGDDGPDLDVLEFLRQLVQLLGPGDHGGEQVHSRLASITRLLRWIWEARPVLAEYLYSTAIEMLEQDAFGDADVSETIDVPSKDTWDTEGAKR